jgi:hypothetical protein
MRSDLHPMPDSVRQVIKLLLEAGDIAFSCLLIFEHFQPFFIGLLEVTGIQ